MICGSPYVPSAVFISIKYEIGTSGPPQLITKYFISGPNVEEIHPHLLTHYSDLLYTLRVRTTYPMQTQNGIFSKHFAQI